MTLAADLRADADALLAEFGRAGTLKRVTTVGTYNTTTRTRDGEVTADVAVTTLEPYGQRVTYDGATPRVHGTTINDGATPRVHGTTILSATQVTVDPSPGWHLVVGSKTWKLLTAENIGVNTERVVFLVTVEAVGT